MLRYLYIRVSDALMALIVSAWHIFKSLGFNTVCKGTPSSKPSNRISDGGEACLQISTAYSIPGVTTRRGRGHEPAQSRKEGRRETEVGVPHQPRPRIRDVHPIGSALDELSWRLGGVPPRFRRMPPARIVRRVGCVVVAAMPNATQGHCRSAYPARERLGDLGTKDRKG